MAGNANIVILIGNLTRDIEVRYTQSQVSVASTSIAVNRKYKDKTETAFLELTAFGKAAEIMQKYASRGTSVFVEGHLQLNQWTTQDGSKRSQLKVVVDKFQVLEFKEQSPQPGDNQYYENQSPYPNDDSGIPF